MGVEEVHDTFSAQASGISRKSQTVRGCRPRTCVDLFAGAGGLSLGLQEAGWDVVLAVENDPNAVTTYISNHPQTLVFQEDIRQTDVDVCLNAVGLRSGELDLLAAGPPCQGFSESNRRTRVLSNPVNQLLQHFARFLKGMNPQYFLLENVVGMRTLAGGDALKELQRICVQLGYVTSIHELNVADFGVPQNRRRLFLVGNRHGIPFKEPSPSHGDLTRPHIGFDEATSDLPVLTNGAATDWLPYAKSTPDTEYQRDMRERWGRDVVQSNLVTRNSAVVLERYRHVKPGENWESIPELLMSNYSNLKKCHTGIYYRLLPDAPSKVMANFRKNMFIHPHQDRGLSVREAARLQSFPDRHLFTGSIGFRQQQVSDAVPPRIAKVLGDAILQQLSVLSDCGESRLVRGACEAK